MIKLQDDFDRDNLTDDGNHFTNYDYIIQLIENGRYSSLKEFLKEIENIGLINLVRNRMKGEAHFADEILRRLETQGSEVKGDN